MTRGSATTTATFTVGVYGLRAYMVAQRTREMGIRIALGATRRDVIGELLREGVRMTAAALLVGGALGLGLIQVLRGSGMLFEVSSTDPFVFTIANPRCPKASGTVGCWESGVVGGWWLEVGSWDLSGE